MLCTLCQHYQPNGVNGVSAWSQKGCATLRLDKVLAHESSSQHRNSISLSLQSTISTIVNKVDRECEVALLDALKVLQFLVERNLPLSLFADLTDLCIDVGSPNLSKLRLAKNASYTSWDIVNELLTLLCNRVRDEVKEEIRAGPCYSVMVDEVCDLTVQKHMAMCVKYLDPDGNMCTSYLADVTLKSATADVITDAITQVIEDNGLVLDNLTGFASDGAAVFTGAKTGVATQLKARRPGLITVHCKDHRLALACKDSFKSNKIFEKTDRLLDDLYKYYRNSSKRSASLKDVQTAFDDAPLSVKEAKHHRWLSHDKAVSGIVRCYRSIVVDLESANIAEDPIGNGLLKNLRDPVTLQVLMLLADALPHLSALSLYFQSESANLGLAKANVDKTLRLLLKLKNVNGIWLGKTKDLMTDLGISPTKENNETFRIAREDFLDALTGNIERRFEDSAIVEALSILDLSTLSEIPAFYGTHEMEQLASHYGMDGEDLQIQWQGFTELASSFACNERSLVNLGRLFHGRAHVDKGLTIAYPLVSRLVSIALVLPLSTATVERVFSQLKLIKTDHRCSLGADTIDKLLMVKLNGSMERFDRLRSVVVADFFEIKNRRLSKAIK
ncbi:zinc finger protein 862-like [Dreissena polymorpha]|uniref:zinc finger protein 862-like n=1 Tax=Dreissena polymorpha TaxID=45954 RepID=UPI0022654CA1|nr:zinc finger protein 862-like [Dreissena polymorpha]